ncbi:hypothetical protein [Sanguibacter suaedae]|uniref:Uncharacterized protein n=1 Tax=Sanguibacter suaedae TaxID=2795737 RepID=A0A934I7H2_9MICO|nr:hypothetical protein [Sanguibacter suaedae]MBI9115636.1 hypothetical protein [Sanguibacter suaedae]
METDPDVGLRLGRFALVIAAVSGLVWGAIVRGLLAGDGTGVLFPDGPWMACVGLADDGSLPGVEPDATPLAADVTFPGSLVCRWGGDVVTHHELFVLDRLSVAMLGAAVAVTVGAAAWAVVTRRRGFPGRVRRRVAASRR